MSLGGAVKPDGRPLPDVVLRVSLHPAIADAAVALCSEFTPVQRRLLRHFRDRTACVMASPAGTGRTTALALGVFSTLLFARDAGRVVEVLWWCGGSPARAGAALDAIAGRLGCDELLDAIELVEASGSPARPNPTILVGDDLPATLPTHLVRTARSAAACIAVTPHAGALQAHAGALLATTGGFYADCTEYAQVRARAWAPLRNVPFPDADAVEQGIADELVRIAHSNGPVRVFSHHGGERWMERARALLAVRAAPAAVSGIASRNVAIEDGRGGVSGEGEVVWIGAPRSVAELLTSLGSSGGLRQDGARVTLMARDADELRWCAAARVALNAGAVEPPAELSAHAPSESLRVGHDELVRALREQLLRDDVRCERAALWLVGSYGINRGNALAVARLERDRMISGP